MKRLLFGMLVVCALSSCKMSTKKAEAEQIIKEWIGRTIQFSNDYQCNIKGRDTTNIPCNPLFQAEYKVLLYVDSAGCTNCRLKLLQWKQLMAESDSLFVGHLQYLFFFQPKDSREIHFILKRNAFDYPVFIDKNNTINQLNHFPDQPEFQCFLLDKDNKVLLIGNPVLNPKIWELYKQTVTGKKDSDTQLVTTVAVAPEEIEIADLSVGKKSYASFKIKNTGKEPLYSTWQWFCATSLLRDLKW